MKVAAKGTAIITWSGSGGISPFVTGDLISLRPCQYGTFPMPTVSAKSTAQTLKIEPLRGAGWTLALSFVYAADDAGLGVAAGDPFPVDGWTWKLDVARAVTSNGKLYAVSIEDTDAAAGTLVLSGTADQLAKSQEALAGRLIGTKTGDVWVALPVEIAPLENVDLAEMPSGQVDDLGLAAVSVGGTTTPVTISVAVTRRRLRPRRPPHGRQGRAHRGRHVRPHARPLRRRGAGRHHAHRPRDGTAGQVLAHRRHERGVVRQRRAGTALHGATAGTARPPG